MLLLVLKFKNNKKQKPT